MNIYIQDIYCKTYLDKPLFLKEGITNTSIEEIKWNQIEDS